MEANGGFSPGLNYLDTSDYAVFGFMLFLPVLIGIYFGCFGSKQKSPLDYLLAGKSMGPIPVALSILASALSGITFIGIPSEVYTENLTFCLESFGVIVACVILYYFYFPVFCESDLSTSYEYLELRFNKNIKTFAGILFIISYLLFLPIIIYVPSLLFSTVTGFDMRIVASVTTLMCIFYTMIGGLKAVIWSDLIQITSSIFSSVSIAIFGTINEGFSDVISNFYNDGKMNVFNMNPDPTIRMTFWTALTGGVFNFMAIRGLSQGNVQRIQSLKSSKNIGLTLAIFCTLFLVVEFLCAYEGMLFYTSFYGCDPIQQNKIAKPDQIFPYYVMERIGYVPALPGLFVSGIFGAAFSTLSTGLNTITQIAYNDFLKSKIPEKHTHKTMMGITLIVGLTSIAGVFIVEKLGRVVATVNVITTITTGPILVLFTLGIMFPKANTKGAIAALISSIAFIAWMSIGNLLSEVNLIMKPVYPGINTCNSTVTMPKSVTDDVFPLYKVSFMMYSFFGMVVGLTCGLIVSYATRSNNVKINPKLIAPPLRRFVPVIDVKFEATKLLNIPK